MFTLHITRTIASNPVSTSYDIELPSIEAVLAYMALMKDDAEAISFSIYQSTSWVGYGIAGQGVFATSPMSAR
jgi:ribosome biogenesis protein Tsr3